MLYPKITMLRTRFARTSRAVVLFGAILALPGLVAAACANSDNIIGVGGGAGGGSGGGATICVLHNCQRDADCAACSEGRQLCDTRAHLCVACNAMTGEGCAKGEVCSKFGTCVAMGADCPSDSHGVPMISCLTSADCAGCDPDHQICDTATSRCVACTATQAGACQSYQTCSADNQCVGVCATSCMTDPDCMGCNIAGQPAFYCAAGKCVNGNGPPPDGGTGGSDGGPTCACHPTCEIGACMTANCDPCAAMVCAGDDYCCKTAWDVFCVGEVAMYCGGMACACSHPECAEGDPLPDNCSACATKVCAMDSFCCSLKWDMQCVSEVPMACGVTC